MKSQYGLYRIHFGSEPVEALYDYETGKVGPFYCPVKLIPDAHWEPTNAIPIYRFYEALQNDRDAIAVWNVNNSTIAVMSRWALQLRSPSGANHLNGESLPAWHFDTPIPMPEGVHIGYIRTFDKTKVVYHYPWYLYFNEQFQRFLDSRFTSCDVVGIPKKDPPLSLYKELLQTEYNAVYIDSLTDKPVFLKGDFNVS